MGNTKKPPPMIMAIVPKAVYKAIRKEAVEAGLLPSELAEKILIEHVEKKQAAESIVTEKRFIRVIRRGRT